MPGARGAAGRAVIAAVILLAPAAAFGQSSGANLVPGDTVVVVPGPAYGASGLRGWFMGRGYRNLWLTPLAVEVADLDRLGGGLAPMRVGGGMTTATLHLRGADGRRYVFRSVDKQAGRGLAAEFQGTVYQSILQDQISAFHPSGALIVARLLDAVAVLHTSPRLYVVPDDPRLGEFREAFAGTLVLFEERPDDSGDGTAAFAGARRVVNSERLLARLRESSRDRVAANEYLVARLVDLLVGDRDRSPNNWLWARPDGPEARWRPIPRDRDQAFIRLDGFLKKELRIYESRLVTFGPRFSSARGLTRNAWDLDRTVLVELAPADWDSAVAFVQRRVTDAVIDAAVAAMPPEHFAIVGPDLAAALRSRRGALPAAARDFFRIVNRYADVTGTDEGDVADLVTGEDGAVTVSLTPRDRIDPYFRRRFSPDETRELRLYLLGGRDRVRIRGPAAPRLVVRVVGGEGADSLIDSTRTGRRVGFYDGGARTHVVTASRTAVSRRNMVRPRLWGERAGLPPDWGRRVDPLPRLGARGDVGVIAGGRIVFTGYGFGKLPYAHRMYVDAELATGVGRVRGEFSRRWRVRPWLETRVRLFGSGFEVIRFHGFGNASAATQPLGFYRVLHRQYAAITSAAVTRGTRWRIAGRLILKRSVTDTTNADTFVAATRPYGSGPFTQAGGELALTFDSRDRPVGATRGLTATLTGTVYPALLSVTEPVAAVGGTVAAYATPIPRDRLVLAGRVGATKVWGRMPFHDAAFLGGPRDLRGFRKQRYAGDAALFGNLELRLRMGRAFVLFPTDIGLVGSADAGRVYLSGDSPGGWHRAWGGGIWLAPVDRAYTASILFMRGEAYQGLYLRSGFLF